MAQGITTPRYVILLGAPGAGKGTQAIRLAERLGLPRIASGDLFREAMAQGTELGKQAKVYMESGRLVPDAITIAMIKERLTRPDCVRGVVLDGFPRTIDQARALEVALRVEGKSISDVLYIAVPTDALLQRLSGRWFCRGCQASFHTVYDPPNDPTRCDRCGGELYQRPDDTPEVARKRIDVYFEQTQPLIDYYRARGQLKEIDGEGSIEEVWSRIVKALGTQSLSMGSRSP